MFIEVDTQVSVSDLIKGVVIQSGNDASVALAEHIAGDETAFSDLMNQYAQQIGMQGSHFVNSSGLPDPEHYTTAGLASVPVAFEDEHLSEELNSARPTDPAVGYAQRMLVGDTVPEIIACAEKENVEMIVMGTHGRTGLGHLLIGSIAEGVVRKATCPVLTIRKAATPANTA